MTLYNVKLPHPNKYHGNLYWCRINDASDEPYIDFVVASTTQVATLAKYQFTEAEINTIDPRFIAFAQEVQP